MKSISFISIIFIVLAIFTSFTYAADEDDDLLLFIPPMIAGISKEPFPPEWGAFSTVCCPSSTATFSVTIDGQTKRSFVPACTTIGDGTFEGFSVTTPGTKRLVSSLRAATCPNLTTSPTVTFEEGLRYLIQLEIQNGQPAIALFAQQITVPSQIDKINTTLLQTEKMIRLENLALEQQNKVEPSEPYQSAK